MEQSNGIHGKYSLIKEAIATISAKSSLPNSVTVSNESRDLLALKVGEEIYIINESKIHEVKLPCSSPFENKTEKLQLSKNADRLLIQSRYGVKVLYLLIDDDEVCGEVIDLGRKFGGETVISASFHPVCNNSIVAICEIMGVHYLKIYNIDREFGDVDSLDNNCEVKLDIPSPAVAFCFGSPSDDTNMNPWLDFTIFIQLSDGRIYCIGPVMPYNVIFSSEQLYNMRFKCFDERDYSWLQKHIEKCLNVGDKVIVGDTSDEGIILKQNYMTSTSSLPSSVYIKFNDQSIRCVERCDIIKCDKYIFKANPIGDANFSINGWRDLQPVALFDSIHDGYCAAAVDILSCRNVLVSLLYDGSVRTFTLTIKPNECTSTSSRSSNFRLLEYLSKSIRVTAKSSEASATTSTATINSKPYFISRDVVDENLLLASHGNNIIAIQIPYLRLGIKENNILEKISVSIRKSGDQLYGSCLISSKEDGRKYIVTISETVKLLNTVPLDLAFEIVTDDDLNNNDRNNIVEETQSMMSELKSLRHLTDSPLSVDCAVLESSESRSTLVLQVERRIVDLQRMKFLNKSVKFNLSKILNDIHGTRNEIDNMYTELSTSTESLKDTIDEASNQTNTSKSAWEDVQSRINVIKRATINQALRVSIEELARDVNPIEELYKTLLTSTHQLYGKEKLEFSSDLGQAKALLSEALLDVSTS